MEKKFVKKYWEEEATLFYIHFEDGLALRQIEIKDGKVMRLSNNEPVIGDSKLYDQSIDDLSIDTQDLITEEEFNSVWNNE